MDLVLALFLVFMNHQFICMLFLFLLLSLLFIFHGGLLGSVVKNKKI